MWFSISECTRKAPKVNEGMRSYSLMGIKNIIEGNDYRSNAMLTVDKSD